KSTRMACLLATTASLAACVTPAGRADPPGALDRSDLFYGTQVSTGPCAGESEAVSFLATLAGAVISRGVDRLGAALQSAAGKDVQTTLARRNVEMSATGFGPCVFVVRGWFHRNNPSARDAGLEFHPEPNSAFPF